MKLLILSACVLLAGCGHVEMDTSAAGDPNRVARGTVELGDDAHLPPDAVVAVRVVDQAHREYKNPNAVLGEPSATSRVSLPPEVLGEQRIDHPQGTSVPFAVKFYSTDDQLSTGLVLEARVSYGGRVRYFNVQSYALNTRNIDDPRRIYVNLVR